MTNQISINKINQQQDLIDRNQRLVQRLNSGQHSPDEIRELISEITGQPIDHSVEIRLPFLTDYGRHLCLGKHVFINSNVQFTDLGGISLADNVLIGPGAMLITVNHQLDPANRRSLDTASIRVDSNAWIGARSVILPGVTVERNAVVAAGAVVTKSVPNNTVVAGVPAKVIKVIEVEDD